MGTKSREHFGMSEMLLNKGEKEEFSCLLEQAVRYKTLLEVRDDTPISTGRIYNSLTAKATAARSTFNEIYATTSDNVRTHIQELCPHMFVLKL